MGKAKNFGIAFILTAIMRYARIFPNNDPIMAGMLPQSRQHILIGVLFAFLSIFIFDALTSGIGLWTWVTSFTYAGIAVLFGVVFKYIKEMSLVKYIGGAVVGVLIFDFITGPIMSTFMFGVPFEISFLGQIPFTFLHLFSAVSYTIIFVPFLDPQVAEQRVKFINFLALKNPIRYI
jgi:hypothetical protein